MNEQTFIGNIGQQPQLVHSERTGNAVLRLSRALNNRYPDRETGQWRDAKPVSDIVRRPATTSDTRRHHVYTSSTSPPRYAATACPGPARQEGTARTAQRGRPTMQWRFELRVQLHHQPTNDRLSHLMKTAARDDWDITRDPIGLRLVTYGPAHRPATALQLLWAHATDWLSSQDLTGHVVDGRVMTETEHEAQALRPDTPALLAATDVAVILGVTRQRVHQLAGRPGSLPRTRGWAPARSGPGQRSRRSTSTGHAHPDARHAPRDEPTRRAAAVTCHVTAAVRPRREALVR
jgi:hypothetical protein